MSAAIKEICEWGNLTIKKVSDLNFGCGVRFFFVKILQFKINVMLPGVTRRHHHLKEQKLVMHLATYFIKFCCCLGWVAFNSNHRTFLVWNACMPYNVQGVKDTTSNKKWRNGNGLTFWCWVREGIVSIHERFFISVSKINASHQIKVCQVVCKYSYIQIQNDIKMNMVIHFLYGVPVKIVITQRP